MVIGYRALVLHFGAHDKRRHKRIDRLLADKRQKLDKLCKVATAKSFFCLADAQAAAEKLHALPKTNTTLCRSRSTKKSRMGAAVRQMVSPVPRG